MMNDEFKNKRKADRRRRSNLVMIAALSVTVIILVLAGCFVRFCLFAPNNDGKDKNTGVIVGDGVKETMSKEDKKRQALEQAYRLAQSYDYDKAAERLRQIDNYSEDLELTQKISEYEAMKSKTKRWDDVTQITHIFFHSLIYDTNKAFKSDSADGYNMVMTTIDEFKNILQSMYEKGFVLVSIHDIVKEVKDDNGNVTYQAGDIMLPVGKKPFVLSQDDVCYYEYMENTGFASRIVLDEQGKPTCEYKNDDGSLSYGAYDMVPIVDEFVSEHPDFSYKGAKGILALTGYNGVLGYRTDPEVYKDSPTLNDDIEAAKKVAEALKNDGWEFASHSWGHIHMAQTSWEKFKEDTDRWEKYVQPIVGDTDIMIYPFGEDVGDWHPYSKDNRKYEYLTEAGFRFFCNVDGSQYWVQLNGDHVRQGRRNIDGQRMWQELETGKNWLDDLFDVKKVFDKARPTPVYEVNG